MVKNVILVLCGLMFSFMHRNEELRKLSPIELRKDVFELRKALVKYHPGLYWYTSKDKFNTAWDSLSASIDTPMTEDEFLKSLLPVVAKVKCAHTLFYPSSDILTRGTRFPLDLKFINGKGYIVVDSLNQYNIPYCSELLAINGKSLKEIVDLVLPSLMAQGGNVGWKYVILENDFQNFYYYIIEHTERFEIEYIDRTTEQKTSTVIEGRSEQRLRTHWKNWYRIEDGAPLKIKFLTNPDVAIITIKSLTKGRYKAYQQDFDRMINQYFEEIKKRRIKDLVIDVRGNEGGNNPELIYSYIANENDENINGSKKALSQNKNAFDGDVVVLMNERSISAQETFVAIFQNNKRGLTIGQSTPGCYKGLCAGNKHRLVLSNSRHEIRIPLHASFRTYKYTVDYIEGQGFPPDIKVEESIDDIFKGKDSAMELALTKLKGGL